MYWTSRGRPDITIERVAINIDDARIADNEGNQPVDVPVVEEGPTAYWSTLPMKAIVKDFKKKAYQLPFHKQQVHSFVITYSMVSCMN